MNELPHQCHEISLHFLVLRLEKHDRNFSVNWKECFPHLELKIQNIHYLLRVPRPRKSPGRLFLSFDSLVDYCSMHFITFLHFFLPKFISRVRMSSKKWQVYHSKALEKGFQIGYFMAIFISRLAPTPPFSLILM